jgi:hypothetical protein
MTSIKISEATNIQLDWLVAQCEGRSVTKALALCKERGRISLLGGMIFSPSTDWSKGGPIIGRARINLAHWTNDGVDTEGYGAMEVVISVDEVQGWTAYRAYGSHRQDGPTALIAAMRCYVASKMDQTAEVPKEI